MKVLYLFIIYLFLINLLSFFFMGLDKKRAVRRQWRIPEKTLFFTAFAFGSLGATLGMYVFRHKTKHWYFVLFMPLLCVMQAILLGLGFVFLM